jgi:lipid-binding SYLF domain-containing protein
MRNYRSSGIALMAFAVVIGVTTPSRADTGAVRVTVAKAGLVLGAGAGRGTLTFRHRTYRFTVQGLSLGATAGVSVTRLHGHADHINELGDFSGYYTVIGGGAALAGGISRARLSNDKGVVITLSGLKAGVEFAANVGSVVILLDQSHSTPD